jgi:hypothetical protein
MTPLHVHALRLRQEQKMQREELLVGIISATISDSGFQQWTPRRTPESFMIHPFPSEPEIAMTGDEIMRAFSHFPMAKAL